MIDRRSFSMAAASLMPMMLAGCSSSLLDTMIKAGTGNTQSRKTRTVRKTSVVSDPAVKEAQTYLSILGYDVGPSDGVMGAKTRDAIALYRSDFGLPGDPQVDAELLDHLAKTVES